MISPRFIQLRQRRNFRYGITIGFLLGIGILAACRIPQRDIVQTIVSIPGRSERMTCMSQFACNSVERARGR